MNKQFKIIIEKHSDGYLAYPLGLKGVVVSEGGTSFLRVMAIVRQDRK